MRTKLKITEGIFPMPVLMVATYNEDGSVNVMNAAWGTMQERDTVVLNLTETHKTVQNIKARGAFTVSIADAAHIVEADYFGVESGNKVADKFARSGLTASKAETVDAPVINEFPICLECRFIEYQNNEYGYRNLQKGPVRQYCHDRNQCGFYLKGYQRVSDDIGKRANQAGL